MLYREKDKKDFVYYYIRNTIDEYKTATYGYFPTKDCAIKALDECQDWYREKGTGKIYEVSFTILDDGHIEKTEKLVFER